MNTKYFEAPNFMKKWSAVILTASLVLVTIFPALTLAVNTPTLFIDTISDPISGPHSPDEVFSCDVNPLYNPVTITGHGVGSAPPGNIDQYGVIIDWGDSTTSIANSTFTPNSGHGDFTFTFTDTHQLTTNGTSNIIIKLFHQNGSGNDNQIDATVSISPCVFVPPPNTGGIAITKVIDNTGGGTKVESDFSAMVTGGNPSQTSFNLSPNPINVSVDAGVEYSVTETANLSYTTGYSAGCSGTVAQQQTVSCVITNTFTPTPPGILHVVKVITNDDGATSTAEYFSFQVDGGVVTAFEADGQNDIAVDPGTYSVTEVTTSGYTASYSNCTDVAIDSGEEATCTITNNDNEVIPPPTEDTLPLCTDGVDNDDDQLIDLADPDCSTFIPKLTVTKIVDGGLKVVADFALFVDLGSITSGVQASSTVGVHIVSETAVANYIGVISGDCASNGSVTLAAGDAKSCTITNTFVQPSQCSDGVDNTDPEDTLADASDPGCWTDPNDSSTYSASDNDETDPSDVCPNDSGIQTSTDQCTPPPTPPAPPTTPPATSPTIGTGRSGDFRNPPGQVLGASTVGP